MTMKYYVLRFIEKSPLFIKIIYKRMKFYLRLLYLNKHRITSKQKYDPFFIIGSGRSGNTLLRSMLVRNSNISIPPENGSLCSMFIKYKAISHMPWNIIVSEIIQEFKYGYRFSDWNINIGDIYKNALSLKGKDRTLASILSIFYENYIKYNNEGGYTWGDKTPPNSFCLFEIERIFPNAKFIHIVRDGRDCVASFVKAGFFESDYKKAAYRWNDALKNCINFSNKINKNKFYQVKYEDLVENTEAELINICDFLNVNYKKEMLDNKISTKKINDVTKRKHHKNLLKPINSSSIGKWKSEIDKDNLERVNSIIGKTLNELGYSE